MTSTWKFTVTLAALMLATVAGAQEAANDQADVWAVVESLWDADENGDTDWMDNLLIDEFSGWENSSPAPRNRSSLKMWDRVMDGVGSMKAHELYPLSINVRGDVAVAHYLYTLANEDKDGNVEMENGRYTDILVRTDAGWKFLAWHGGASD
jgi:ketosteroid isomerase-like protein